MGRGAFAHTTDGFRVYWIKPWKKGYSRLFGREPALSAQGTRGGDFVRRRCGKRARREWLTVVAAAFGAGLFLALFCSLKFALLVAAIALIYLGLTFRP